MIIEYVTCTDCLKEGKPQNKPNPYADENVVMAIRCPHCDKYLNQDTYLN